MRRTVYTLIVVAAISCVAYVLNTNAAKKVGGYVVLDEGDWNALGYGWKAKQMDTLLTGLATILPSTGTKPVDGINCDSARVTTVNATTTNTTSLAVSDSGFIDTLVTTRVRTANTGDAYISEIDTGTTGDTLKIVIGGKTMYIAKTR